jgi:hypothetical protein
MLTRSRHNYQKYTTNNMENATASLKVQFDLHTRLFNNVLDSITEADANFRENDRINHIKWVAGHALNTRLTSMAKIVGRQPDETYAGWFARGVALDPNAKYPPIAEIAAKWKDAAPALSEGIAHIPEEVLSAPAPAKAPIADDTVRGFLSFVISHEAYHIGQLSLLRKLAGKDAMSYN